MVIVVRSHRIDGEVNNANEDNPKGSKTKDKKGRG